MSLSKKTETPQVAYSKIRNKGHNLEELHRVCQQASKGKYKIISRSFLRYLSIVNKFGVGIRYELDFIKLFRQQTWEYGKGTVSKYVLDAKFLNLFYEEVYNLEDRALKRYSKRFKGHIAQIGTNYAKAEAALFSLI